MRIVSAAAAAVAAFLLAAGCASQSPSTSQAPAAPPRLVVLLVIDGLPQRQVVDYRDQLGPDGFRRFLDRGAWFTNANYGYAYTVTAAGHASLATGTYPYRHGIIGNDWRDVATGENQYCTGDADNSYIGHKTSKNDGTSPKNLKVEAFGDALKRAVPAAKVIGISVKDRGAILPAGKNGTAYMYMSQSGQYVSTTYYMKDHPQWVKDYNARKPADAYFKQAWKPMLDEAAYARSLPDEQKWFSKGGKLPKVIGEGQDAPGPAFYGALTPSPYGDRMALDFARAAIAGESLGADDAPDFLSISLSSHDYINHAYGAESRLSHDHILQLDRLLEAFFQDLDARIGKGKYIVALSADHGFMPAPEHSQQLGRAAGRQPGSQIIAKVNAAVGARFGEGAWVKSISALGLLFDRKLLAERKVPLADLAEEARKAVVGEPAIAAAYTRQELESGSRAGAPFFDQMRKSWNQERSADVQMAVKPYWMLTSLTNMTTHGSPHRYDTNVPILVYGPAWVRPGQYDVPVEPIDIVSTFAKVAGVAPPAAAEGKVLPILASH